MKLGLSGSFTHSIPTLKTLNGCWSWNTPANNFLTWFEIRRCFFQLLKSLLRLLRYCHFPQCTAPLKKKKQSFKNWGGRIQREACQCSFFKSKSVFPGAKGEWVSRSARDSPHLCLDTRWEPYIAGAKPGRKAPAWDTLFAVSLRIRIHLRSRPSVQQLFATEQIHVSDIIYNSYSTSAR